jgi:hypothetical protein
VSSPAGGALPTRGDTRPNTLWRHGHAFLETLKGKELERASVGGPP